MFITFEGIDGSGKTTQARRVYSTLRAWGYDVILTREPGGTDIGDQIRGIVLDNMKNTHMHAHTELLLFCASRAQLVHELIVPSLERGTIVLCDRYADSTLAYQGYGHGLAVDELRQILRFATGGLVPDASVYLHLDPASGLQRRQKRLFESEEWNRLDALELDFHRRVYQGYETLIANDRERWIRVDASPDELAVHDTIMRQLKVILPAPPPSRPKTTTPSGS